MHPCLSTLACRALYARTCGVAGVLQRRLRGVYIIRPDMNVNRSPERFVEPEVTDTQGSRSKQNCYHLNLTRAQHLPGALKSTCITHTTPRWPALRPARACATASCLDSLKIDHPCGSTPAITHLNASSEL